MVYTTSFRGLRATFEECKYALALFHNLRVAVEERDVYVHRFFLRELEERLHGSRVSVPHIFIGGQHIGVRAIARQYMAERLMVHLSVSGSQRAGAAK